MARSSAATAHVGVVHPASSSRIERASNELLDIRKKLADLEEQKKALSARILTMVRAEGEADDEGKVRYETDAHKFIVIDGRNVSINEGKLKKAMLACNLTPKVIKKCLDASMSITKYQYVGVYEKKGDDEEEKARA